MESKLEQGVATSTSSNEESQATMTTKVKETVSGQRVKVKLKNKLCEKPKLITIVVASIIVVAFLTSLIYYTVMYTNTHIFNDRPAGPDATESVDSRVDAGTPPNTQRPPTTTKRQLTSNDLLKGTVTTTRKPTEDRFGVAEQRGFSQRPSTPYPPDQSIIGTTPKPARKPSAYELRTLGGRPRRPTQTKVTTKSPTTTISFVSVATTMVLAGNDTEENIAGINVD